MQLNGAPATMEQVTALALTNYGHFTSMLVEDGRVRGLSLHMQRLTRDCRLLFDLDLDTDRVRHYLRHALTDAAARTVARVTVYDPALDLGRIGSNAVAHILVTTRPAPSGTSAALRLQAACYRREMPAVKHIGLFGALRCRRRAQREGYDDVLFLNPDGTISELATSNIGFVREGQTIWPRSEWLTGITMTLLNQALNEPIHTEPITLSDLPTMESAFATNAATGIRPVAAVDDQSWPTDHPALEQLRDLYMDIPAEQLSRHTYAAWAGKSLPSGQQWEKAARGTRGTVYPWGDQPTPAKCNVRENGVGGTTAVDCYHSGVSPYGVLDLCGNVWEWCSTATRPGRYELKGGAWTSPLLRATPSSFNDAAATMCDDDTGFRCAATTETLDR